MMFAEVFKERLIEIEQYLDLLQAIETEVQKGPPTIGKEGPVITTAQQKMLYSSIYLQLYNLVEATITKSLEAVSSSISNQWKPMDLSEKLLKEWVRYAAQTHTDLNFENRLSNSLKLCQHTIKELPVNRMDFKRGGGNWDDDEISRMANRLGCQLNIAPESLTAIKQHIKDNLGALGFIVRTRNELAHGTVSFMECGEGVTVAQLRELTDRTKKYLSDVVTSFKTFIETHEYLQPERRPTGS